MEKLAERVSIIGNGSAEVQIDHLNHSVACRASSGEVELTVRWFVERADEFSKLVGNTYTFFKSNTAIDEGARKKILTHLDLTEASIGVVASPSFEAIERLEPVLMFIATELKALIFNGEEMLDSVGDVVS